MSNTYVQNAIEKVDVSEVLNKHAGGIPFEPEIINKPIHSLKNIAGALAKAQLEMKNPALDKTNPFFHSKYASLAAVRDASIPILAKHGIATMQLLSNAPNGDIICTTTLLHTSGEFITSDLVLPATKKDAQGLGSASTYARRYALQAIVGIVGEDDDDGNESTKKQTSAQEAPPEQKQEQPSISGGAICAIGTVIGIRKETKTNRTTKKEFIVYHIKLDNNVEYTASGKDAESLMTLAKTAATNGFRVKINTKGDQYNTIIKLDTVEPDFSDPELKEDDINNEPLPWETERT